MVRPIETVQDQEWHDWKQIKAEQYKREQEQKEFQAWKALQKKNAPKILFETPKGHEIFKSIWGPPKPQRFAF